LKRKTRYKCLLVEEIANDRHRWIYENELATKAHATMRDLSLRILPVFEDHKKHLGELSRRDVMTISSSVSPIRVEKS
jgi:CBS-domain-containing membrane protein